MNVAVKVAEMRLRLCIAGLLTALLGSGVVAQPRARSRVQSTSARALIIVAEPAAIVWLDEIRRGTTDAGGRLMLPKVSPGTHTLRVRASGFKETMEAVSAGARGGIKG